MNPVLALVFANIIWGAASPIFKYSLQNIPPFTLAFIRFFFAGVILLPFVVPRWRKVSLTTIGEVCIGAFFAVTINISFYFLALPKTDSINAPVIASSAPIFLYIFSILFLKERPQSRILWGILISFIGVIGIILSPLFVDGGISEVVKNSAFVGNLFLIIATFGSIAQTLIFKKILKKIPHLQASLISFFFGSLTFIPFMRYELMDWSFSALDIRGVVGIVFGVFFSSAAAYCLFNYGISKIKAQEVGIFTYIDPVVAVLLAIPLIHEYPTVYFYAGSLLIFAGILIAEGRIHYHPFHKLKLYMRDFQIKD